MTGSRKGMPGEVEKRSSKKHLAMDDGQGQSTWDSRETNRHEIGSSHSEEDESR